MQLKTYAKNFFRSITLSYIAVSYLLDILFVMTFGFFFNNLVLNILYIIAQMRDILDNVRMTNLFDALVLLKDFKYWLFLFVFLLYVAFYICWSLFQGLNWKILLRAKGDYLKKFFLLNFFLFLAVAFVIIITSAMTFLIPPIFQFILLSIVGILLVVLLLMVPFLYVYLSTSARRQQTFYTILKASSRRSFRKVPVSFVIHAGLILALFLIDAILNISAGLVLGFVLVFPAFALYRLAILEFSR